MGPLAVFAACLALTFDVRINQAGFAPDAFKEFTIENPPTNVFVVQTVDAAVRYHGVFTGRLERVNGNVWKGDFSCIRRPADYRILVGGDMNCPDIILPKDFEGSACHSFVIRNDPFAVAERFIFTFFTWQRCGSEKGWAGRCHQDPVPLYGTGRKLDMRGGYHQSGDLRCWADGISLSLYSLLRWAEVRQPCWDTGEVDEELRWGCDYFLKLVCPEGYAYDCQFVPIGWGPRDYYPQPAAFPGQLNICCLLARAARRFRPDAVYARRLTETAERMWRCIETYPGYDVPYREMVSNLPGGCQPARYYVQSVRESAVGYTGRALAALELYRTTGKEAYAEKAKEYGRKFLALQVTDGPYAGAYRQTAGSDELGLRDCSYGHRLHGVLTPLELYLAFGDEACKTAFLRTCDLFVRMLDADPYGSVPNFTKDALTELRQGKAFCETLQLLIEKPPYVNNVRAGTATTAACRIQIALNEAARRFGRNDLLPYAARMRDWIYGGNPGAACYVTGLGYNCRRRNVFGQFFPSTPPIPGGVSHVLNGEYDLPAGGMALWAIASESK